MQTEIEVMMQQIVDGSPLAKFVQTLIRAGELTVPASSLVQQPPDGAIAFSICERDGSGGLGLTEDQAEAVQGRVGSLVSAAPDLLRAAFYVKQFLSNLEDGLPKNDPLVQFRKQFHAPLHAILDAAIDKARGLETIGTESRQELGSVSK